MRLIVLQGTRMQQSNQIKAAVTMRIMQESKPSHEMDVQEASLDFMTLEEDIAKVAEDILWTSFGLFPLYYERKERKVTLFGMF